MRLLLLSNFFSPCVGGVETHLSDLCEYLASRGHLVQVITYQPNFSQPAIFEATARSLEKQANLQIRRIGRKIPYASKLLPRFSGTPFELLYFAPALLLYSFFFTATWRKHIDVVYAHGLVPAVVGLVLSRFFRKRSLVSLHWIIGLKKKRVVRFFSRIVLLGHQNVLTISQASKAELVRSGLPPAKIQIFRYWVNQTVFKPMVKSECKHKLGLDGRFVVLFVGRLIKEKGIELLVNVARRFVNNRLGNTVFVIVGDGPMKRNLDRVSKRLNTLVLAGMVNNSILPLYYNAADLVVVPSIHDEGFGRVVAEALSCGTPVVASNRGGIPEALNSSVGFIVEPDVSNFTNAIRILQEDEDRLQQMSHRARQFAEENFSVHNATIIEAALVGSPAA